jgi:hypothetical protein
VQPVFTSSSSSGLHGPRAQRAQARLQYTSAGYRIARIVVYALAVPFVAIVLGSFVPYGVRWVLHPSDAARRMFLTSLTYAAIGWPIAIFFWMRGRRITLAIKALASATGGTWGKRRFLSVLDWLDAHWPADTAPEVLDTPVLGEGRWDVQTSHRGRPVLVVVQNRSRRREFSEERRVSFYLSAPNASPPPGYDPSPALRELEAMGLYATRTPAGVVMAYPGVSAEVLDRDRVHRALDMAWSLAEGRPLMR